MQARVQVNNMGYLCPSHIQLPGTAFLLRQKELLRRTVWDKFVF